MISSVFNAIIYNPLYNGLVFLIDFLPSFDVGLIIIIFTILVKLILFPISKQAVSTQLAIKELEPETTLIKEKYKNDKQKQAEETMKLYKERKVKPFSSMLLVLIQIPIIFGLYFIFLRGGLPSIDTNLLYSFIPVPSSVKMTLFGIFDISGRSVTLAVLTGITQFIQTRISMPTIKQAKMGESLKGDIARTMQVQMKYVMPVIVAFISYTLSSVIALYWTTSNLFTILQELIIRKKKSSGK